MAVDELTNIILVMDFGGGSPEEFAHLIVHERRIPIYQGYAFACVAATWLSMTQVEAEERKHYEAEAWYHFGLNQVATGSASPVVGVVGLATGEGLGEIELLRNVLRDGHTVHYLAVDLSPVLLTAHVEIIREIFEQDLREGKLFCAGVLGDFFNNPRRLIDKARDAFATRGCVNVDGFLPPGTPLLVSFLGNCLGNDSYERERNIFTTISRAFPNNKPLSIITGFSVMRDEPDQYSNAINDLMLRLPRYLCKELKLIQSEAPPADRSTEEFEIPSDVEQRNQRLPKVIPTPYTSHGLEGQLYHFRYNLAYGLRVPSEDAFLPAGTSVLLYTVTKFKPGTLVEFLKGLGYSVRYDPAYHDIVHTEFGIREYAVLAAVLE